jgi:hypothetical protein
MKQPQCLLDRGLSRGRPLELTLYRKAKLMEHRRSLLRYARSFPVGPDRNRHKQVALLVRALFEDKKRPASHSIDGSCGDGRSVPERNLVRRIGPDGEDCKQTMDGGSN